MIDSNITAAGAFYRAVNAFAERTQNYETAIFYYTKPDEAFNLPLVSFRVYGNHYEFLAVMAAASLSNVGQELTQQRLILPTPAQLVAIKRQTGFESNPELRENFKPIWSD
jgi:hypothetical protein